MRLSDIEKRIGTAMGHTEAEMLAHKRKGGIDAASLLDDKERVACAVMGHDAGEFLANGARLAKGPTKLVRDARGRLVRANAARAPDDGLTEKEREMAAALGVTPAKFLEAKEKVGPMQDPDDDTREATPNPNDTSDDDNDTPSEEAMVKARAAWKSLTAKERAAWRKDPKGMAAMLSRAMGAR